MGRTKRDFSEKREAERLEEVSQEALEAFQITRLVNRVEEDTTGAFALVRIHDMFKIVNHDEFCYEAPSIIVATADDIHDLFTYCSIHGIEDYTIKIKF